MVNGLWSLALSATLGVTPPAYGQVPAAALRAPAAYQGHYAAPARIMPVGLEAEPTTDPSELQPAVDVPPPPPEALQGVYGEPRLPADSQEPWLHGYIREIPAYGGFNSARPYNYKHVQPHAQTAGGWGMSPQAPYSQQFWGGYHDEATMRQHLTTLGTEEYAAEIARLKARQDFQEQLKRPSHGSASSLTGGHLDPASYETESPVQQATPVEKPVPQLAPTTPPAPTPVPQPTSASAPQKVEQKVQQATYAETEQLHRLQQQIKRQNQQLEQLQRVIHEQQFEEVQGKERNGRSLRSGIKPLFRR